MYNPIMEKNLKEDVERKDFKVKIYRFLYKYFLTVSCFVIALILLANLVIYSGLYRGKNEKFLAPPVFNAYEEHDLSCYEMDLDYVPKLPVFNGSVISEKRIFFLETSCKGGLDSKQACAVEAATRAHPHWRVELVFLAQPHPDFFKGSVYNYLQNSNLFYSRIQLSKFLQHTKLAHLSRIRDWLDLTSNNPEKVLSELLKILMLKWYGGVAVDLDTVVTKPFDNLTSNWVVSQDGALTTVAMRLSNDKMGRLFVNDVINKMKRALPPYMNEDSVTVWMDEVMKKICVTTSGPESSRPQGVKEYTNFIYQYFTTGTYHGHAGEYLKPIHFFKPPLNEKDMYIHHVPNYYAPPFKMPYARASIYAEIAKQYCPTVYEMYGDRFGL